MNFYVNPVFKEDNYFDYIFVNKNKSYEINPFNIFKQIFKYLKSHVSKIISYINDIINKIKIHDVEKIKLELFNLSVKLDLYDYFKKEFYNFLLISDLIEYILDNNLKNNLNFAELLLNDFLELINMKQKSVDNSEKYDEYYTNYQNRLNKNEEYFYNEIYKPTHKYEDTISKITNILE